MGTKGFLSSLAFFGLWRFGLWGRGSWELWAQAASVMAQFQFCLTTNGQQSCVSSSSLGHRLSLECSETYFVAKPIQQCILCHWFCCFSLGFVQEFTNYAHPRAFPLGFLFIELIHLSPALWERESLSNTENRTNPRQRQISGEAWQWVTKATRSLLKSVLAAAPPFVCRMVSIKN